MTPQAGYIRAGDIHEDVGFRDASAPRPIANGSGSSYSTTGTTLSLPSTAFKHGDVGARRVSIPSIKFRQKSKRQRLQVGIQRGEQQHALTLTVSSGLGDENFVLGRDGGVIEEHHINLESGFQCDIILPPPISMAKNRAEQIFAGSPDMKNQNESVKRASEIISLESKKAARPTTSVLERPRGKLREEWSLDRAIKQHQLSVETNSEKGVVMEGGGRAKVEVAKATADAMQEKEQELRKDTHSTCSPMTVSLAPSKSIPMKTPIPLVSSTSLGAISRQAQAQDGCQTVRPPGLYPSAITIK